MAWLQPLLQNLQHQVVIFTSNGKPKLPSLYPLSPHHSRGSHTQTRAKSKKAIKVTFWRPHSLAVGPSDITKPQSSNLQSGKMHVFSADTIFKKLSVT